MFAVLNTPHLVLRRFAPTDTPEIFRFMSNASAMEHTYVAHSLEECSARLSAYEAMRTALGFAPWVVSHVQSCEVIGWGGLSVDLEEPERGLEVSYAFSPIVWGKGYATELVLFSLAYAFGQLSAKTVYAFAKPENDRSVRVLQKCGFSHQCYEPLLKRDHYLAHAPGAA